MSPRIVTGFFIIGVILLIAVYDFVAYVWYGASATISDVVREWGRDWPLLQVLVAFAMGVLFGHIFFG